MAGLIEEKIIAFVAKQTATKQQKRIEKCFLQDGELHVLLVGTGSPLPSPFRVGPCTVVVAGKHIVMFDCGPGSFARLQNMGVYGGLVSSVVLTHFHSDHIGELGEVCTMSWVMSGRTTPLPVYGPPGVERVVDGFNSAYSQDSKYREDHHTVKYMPKTGAPAKAITIPLPGGKHDDLGGSVVIDEGPDGLKITGFNVDHTPVLPAFGYKVEYKGRTVLISGDTKKCKSMEKWSKGCDLLVHEGIASHILKHVSHGFDCCGNVRNSQLLGDIQDYHTNIQETVDLARESNVAVLGLTHLVPAPDNFLARKLFMRYDAKGWEGKVVLGEDGDCFTLPINTTTIRHSNLFARSQQHPLKYVASALLFLLLAILYSRFF